MFGKKAPSGSYPLIQPNAPSAVKLVEDNADTDNATQTSGTSLVTSESFSVAKAVFKDAPLLAYTDTKLENADYKKTKREVIENLLDRVDFVALESLPKEVRKDRIRALSDTFLQESNVPLNGAQINLLKTHVVDEVLGFGPLEPLLADPDVADIMVNAHEKVYIEKAGKIYLTDITFSSEKHLLNIIQKIVTFVGRRIDENSPMVDARMPDGSRFNAIIPPLALDGALVSIRKFKKNKLPLTAYVDMESMSPAMAKFLEICANIRVNIIISGGTGSGKTTLLNALSGHIDPGERIVTIEDAAELQMHQPHVLRLETRPANTEGLGEVTQRQLVKNALRMRPDRIILGEVRGDEVVDVLTAMNTGHEGSMATIHSNSPRDCLTRLENLIGMSGLQIPTHAMRHQIASSIHVIIQISRMRDGKRRITQIEEVVGMEGEVISTQPLFGFKAAGLGEHGNLLGEFYCSGIRPRFLSQAVYYGRDKELLECITHGM